VLDDALGEIAGCFGFWETRETECDAFELFIEFLAMGAGA
jgi:hypothetical protein